MKVLCIHASAGAGHLKAAEALYDGIKSSTDHEVILVDALDYTSPFFKRMYRDSYFFMISKIPFFWAIAFAILDIPCLQPIIRFIRRIYNTINGRKLHEFLIKENFDYILSTHFMPNEVSSALKRKGKIGSTIITAVTDYDVHKIWLADYVDTFAVACDWTRKKLISIGIDEAKILVTGVPTNEKFSQQYDMSELKQRLGIKEGIFTALVATGSFGIGPIKEIINECEGIQIVVVCGHNKNLFESLNKDKGDLLRVFGLVDNMHEIMSAVDMMVTKPGGLSISEALVKNLPMIFFNPIPGQETNNIMVLKEYGIGLSNCGVKEIAAELKKMQSSQDVFAQAVEKTKQLARPSSVRDVINLIK